MDEKDMLQFNTELQTASGGQSVRVKLTVAAKM